MRPLRLDIAGFAAFRDPITVDFTDADYFALTGPTGSGKSTVIDAMTFALYGSAPRWGRENAIQYALAPTANRCAVRLVFDVAGQRYVVAREVRRSGKQIAQKNPRLERYLDAEATGDPDTDEPVESLAADARSVRQQVAELLGLDFDDFCTCVVLPQGDFATFLQASVAERQTILLKPLGARHYETIARLANRRANDAGARIEALQGQLSGYDDATEETAALARARETTLAQLAVRIRTDVDALSELLVDRSEQDRRIRRLGDELALLTRVEVPADIAALQESLTAADQAYEVAGRAEREADTALARAEEALLAGPQRGPLEETLRWHGEREQASDRLPDVAREDEAAAAALTAAQETVGLAERELIAARSDHDQHRTTAQQSARRVAEVEQRLQALQSVIVPDGTDDLDRAAVRARSAVEQATADLEAAEATVVEASAAVTALPERSALTAIRRSVQEYANTAEQVVTLDEELTAEAQVTQAAEQAAAEAVRELDAARTTLELLTMTSAAAGLRPQLAVGHACPVCDQTVAVLPPPLREPAVDDARTALATAEEQQRTASAEASRAQARLTALTSRRDAQLQRLGALDRQLQQEIPTQPSGDDRNPARDHQAVEIMVSRLDEAQAAQQSALRDREVARTAVRSAEQESARIADDARQSWEILHTTRGRLAELGAPDITDSGLAASWAALSRWCGSQTEISAGEGEAARRDAVAADRDLAAATERLELATSAAQTAVEQRQAAAVTASTAHAEHVELQRRLAELTEALAGRPSTTEARALLTEHEHLDTTARSIRARAQAASLARQEAETERDRWRTARESARTALHRAREPLVPLGVPALDDADLGGAWTALLEWTSAEAVAHQTRLDAGRDELATTDDHVATQLTTVDELLVAHELPPTALTLTELLAAPGPTRLQRIATGVEIAVERARAATAEIERRRVEAEGLRTKITADTDVAQVARQLAQMMSAKRFPQWLADAALDTLVADASASLLELSGRQFELTHEKGEFFVIDHADADSLRSVKTLSGGETFQASLALALALSEQLSTLAAGGRTTLDSIFLDEGFGTLDPDALEVVASTLENLAQGRRMVGVVTHVAALAERVPVRFEVSRDSRTSTIERVGP